MFPFTLQKKNPSLQQQVFVMDAPLRTEEKSLNTREEQILHTVDNGMDK
jgi:hypothetical protein